MDYKLSKFPIPFYNHKNGQNSKQIPIKQQKYFSKQTQSSKSHQYSEKTKSSKHHNCHNSSCQHPSSSCYNHHNPSSSRHLNLSQITSQAKKNSRCRSRIRKDQDNCQTTSCQKTKSPRYHSKSS